MMQLRFLIASTVIIALIACVVLLVTEWNLTPPISQIERTIPHEKFLNKKF